MLTVIDVPGLDAPITDEASSYAPPLGVPLCPKPKLCPSSCEMMPGAVSRMPDFGQ